MYESLFFFYINRKKIQIAYNNNPYNNMFMKIQKCFFYLKKFIFLLIDLMNVSKHIINTEEMRHFN